MLVPMRFTSGFFAFSLLASAACFGSRTPLAQRGDGGVVTVCGTDGPTCVTTGDDPCGLPKLVTPDCDESTKKFHCPSGTVERAPNPTGVCRPYHDGTIAAIGGSMTRIPTDDGRCYWIAEDAVVKGTKKRNLAIDATDDVLYGACPQKPAIVGEIVDLAVPDPANYVVQLLGGVKLGTDIRVLYRLFRLDASGPLGLVELGGGFARWTASGRLAVPGPGEVLWGPELSLGDAFLVKDDRLYVWGCPPPVANLTEKCIVARFEVGSDEFTVYQSDGSWSHFFTPSQAGYQFDAGPWLGSVVPRSGGFLHTTIVGYGSDVQAQTASKPEGPWTAAPKVRACDLPSGDKQSFCAGPIVHEEMMNPKNPNTLVIVHGVGTTASDASYRLATFPDDYWPRLVWVTP